jgi:apolipoprotein N-acyltransferase
VTTPDLVASRPQPTRGVVRPLGALAAGVVVALSLPPWGFWPLAFVGIAIFELALGTSPTRRQAALRSFVFAAAWTAIGMCWMWFLTAPGYVFSFCLFGAFHAVAGAVAPSGRWRVIGRPAAHTVVEAIRFGFPFGGVPLASLGISQAGGPLLGVARVGGVVLLTWVVFQVGFAAGAIVRERAQLDVAVLSGALAVVVLVVVAAAFAPTGRASGRSLTVAAVQGGGEQGTSALDVPSRIVTERLLEATRTIEPGDELDLVVWPENGIDVDDQRFEASDAYRTVADEAARLGVPLSVGITEDSEFSTYPSDGAFVNAQIVVTPEGAVTSRYEKVRIVPFGEYVPLRSALDAIGAPVDQIPSDAVAGRDPAFVELPDGTRLGVMISWEVFFGGRGRAAAGNGVAVLLNPTNGASYTGTILQTQQIASSRLRAVENGRWVVQVSPTGFTAFVTDTGEVLQRTDVSEQRVITAEVPLREGTTWFHTLGSWPWALAALACVTPGVRHRRLRRGVTPGV